MQQTNNPDTRPLPEGWSQHFDAQKQIWFYVKTSAMPPQVSVIHPSDGQAASVSPPQEASQSGMKPDPFFSQQPFNSSQKGSGTLPPAIRPLPQTNQISISSDARTSPLSASPSLVQDGDVPTSPYEARLTPDGVSRGNTPSTGSGQSNEAPGVAAQRSSGFSPPSPASLPQALYNVALAQNLCNRESQVRQEPQNSRHAPLYQSVPDPMKADYIPQSLNYALGKQVQGAKFSPTPNIITTTQPLSYSQYGQKSQINNVTGPTTLPQHLSPNIPVIAYTLAQTEPLLSDLALQTLVQNPQHTQAALQAAQTAAALKTVSQIRTKDATYALEQMGKAIGKSTTKVAKKVAQGAILVTTGIDTVAVGKAIMNSDAVTSLNTTFPSPQSQAGINVVQLQAVLQGQLGADYQAMINALTLQQLKQQQNPSQVQKINYQTLINEIRRLQLIANQHAISQQQALIQALPQQQDGGLQQNTLLQLQLQAAQAQALTQAHSGGAQQNAFFQMQANAQPHVAVNQQGMLNAQGPLALALAQQQLGIPLKGPPKPQANSFQQGDDASYISPKKPRSNTQPQNLSAPSQQQQQQQQTGAQQNNLSDFQHTGAQQNTLMQFLMLQQQQQAGTQQKFQAQIQTPAQQQGLLQTTAQQAVGQQQPMLSQEYIQAVMQQGHANAGHALLQQHNPQHRLPNTKSGSLPFLTSHQSPPPLRPSFEGQSQQQQQQAAFIQSQNNRDQQAYQATLDRQQQYLQPQTQTHDILVAAYQQQQQHQKRDQPAMYTSGGGLQQFGQDQTFDAEGFSSPMINLTISDTNGSMSDGNYSQMNYSLNLATAHMQAANTSLVNI